MFAPWRLTDAPSQLRRAGGLDRALHLVNKIRARRLTMLITGKTGVFFSNRLFLLVALLSTIGLARNAKAWTLQNLETTKIQATSCNAPTSTTSFSTTDSNVYLYFVVRGLKSG